VKPLVFALKDGVLAFASTVRALRVAGCAGELNDDAIGAFLQFGFLPDERCIYRGITKVQAGSIVEWSEGTVSTRTYWARGTRFRSSKISFREAVEETRRLLLESVRLRLRADVSVGALLSGGIDSGLVCWAVHELGGDVRTYTVGTPDDPWDETAAAKETARRLNLNHHVVEMSDDDVPDIEELVSAYGEPFGSASALGMLRVSRTISRSTGVKVLLTGDGGDDVFLGYPRHRNLWIASRLCERLPANAAEWWRVSRAWVPRIGALRRAAALLDYTTRGIDGVAQYSTELQRDVVEDLFGARLRRDGMTSRVVVSEPSGLGVLTDFLQHEFKNRFVGEYMTKVDGATMRYGIEARSPFLDHCLWEFADALPFDIRLHRGRLKAVLRQLASDEIGHAVARRPKRGFGIPVQRWIVGRWRAWTEQVLRYSLLERDGWTAPGSLLRQFEQAVRSGEAPLQLWYAISLEAWMRHEGMASVGHASRHSAVGSDVGGEYRIDGSNA
jgi:asparagine synthase (glutamine-hydrolysing)